MQKWPEKGWRESYSKDIMKRTLITDGVGGGKEEGNKQISVTKEWLVYLRDMG